MHLLYIMLHLNRPLSTTHIQYKPNTIKYNAPKCSTLTVNRIVLTKVFCLTLHEPSADVWTECKQVVQVCAKYVLSMTVCKLWKCAKYESVRSMCKVCTKYESVGSMKLCKVWKYTKHVQSKCKLQANCASMKVKPDHRLLIRQPLSLHTEGIKKWHQNVMLRTPQSVQCTRCASKRIVQIVHLCSLQWWQFCNFDICQP